MTWTVRRVEGGEAREDAMAIRHEVFVRENGVPAELERDALDPECEHFIVLHDTGPVGAGRRRMTNLGMKLERVAVRSAYRGRGAGRRLVASMLDGIPDGTRVYVHAQAPAVPFWRSVGFVAEGDPFREAGIDHYLMIRSGAGPNIKR